MRLINSLFKLMITVIITLILMILIKGSSDFKDLFYKKVYETNFSFAKVNNWYQKHFGSSLPFKDTLTVKPVFRESLVYSKKEPYLDGIKLSVDDTYLVPALNSGIVVFIGEKEGYGNVVIVQQIDGIDRWYGNMDQINVKLYDYLEEGTLLGNCHSELYLLDKKEGNIIPYEEISV